MRKYSLWIFLLALFCLALLSQREKAPQQNQPAGINNYTEKKHTVNCDCGDSSRLIVETLYLTVPDSLSYHGIFIIEQKLHFVNGKSSKFLALPFFNRKIGYKPDSLTVEETALYEVKCIFNDKRQVYMLYGGNWFDPPHEFFGLCSVDGNWLAYYYGSMYETFKEYGDYQVYEQEFGEDIHSLEEMISVLPENSK